MADKKISALTAASTPLAGTEVLPIVQSGATVKVSVASLTLGRDVGTQSLTASGAINPIGNSGLPTSTGGSSYITGGWSSPITGRHFIGDGTGWSYYLSKRNASVNTDLYQFADSGNMTLLTGNVVQGTAAKGFNFSANTPTAGMTSQLLSWYEEGTWTPSITFGNASVGVTYDLRSGFYTRIGNMVMLTCYIDLSNKGSSTGAARIAGLPFTVANNNGAYAPGSLWFDVITYSGVVNCYANINTTTVDILQTTEAGVASALSDTNFANTTRLMLSIMYRAA